MFTSIRNYFGYQSHQPLEAIYISDDSPTPHRTISTTEKVRAWAASCWNSCVEATIAFFRPPQVENESPTCQSRTGWACRRAVQMVVLPGTAVASCVAMGVFAGSSSEQILYPLGAIGLGSALSFWPELSLPTKFVNFVNQLLVGYSLEIYWGLTQVTLNLNDDDVAAHKSMEAIFVSLSAYYMAHRITETFRNQQLDEEKLFPIVRGTNNELRGRNYGTSPSVNVEVARERRIRHHKLPLTPFLQGSLSNKVTTILSQLAKASASCSLLIIAYNSHNKSFEVFKDLGWFFGGHLLGSLATRKLFTTWENLVVKNHRRIPPVSLKVIRLAANLSNIAHPLVSALPLIVFHPATYALTGAAQGYKAFLEQWKFEVLPYISEDRSAFHVDLETEQIQIVGRNQLEEIRGVSFDLHHRLALATKVRRVANVFWAAGFYAWFSAAILTTSHPAEHGALLSLFGSVLAGRYIGRLADNYFSPALRYQHALDRIENPLNRTYRKLHMRAINTFYFYLHQYPDWSMLTFQYIINKIAIDDQSLVKNDELKLFFSYLAYGTLGFSIGANGIYNDSTRKRPGTTIAERNWALMLFSGDTYNYLAEAVQGMKMA
ncbi:Conserved hypothetical protein [Candidatus Protochlamydia naegleriophila]|uniref:Uncharacterized protein n=1 Tax=Candidatus Protochlamydia naegleriophila TaxID=389348 RepID=A0A0U5JDT9_9BACT|nr:hypothetical protein [Candidatus Protochlamydia naegleriophila]CUI17277.1 Conserved hypothetical protein [Candidatus Protochlamydia naegleriophila]